MPPLHERARAKINLYLHITGRRPPESAHAGYHELDSLFAFLDLHDVVTAAPADRLSLSIDGPFAPALGQGDAANIVMKTAKLLAGEAGIPAAAALTLTKHIPVAAGLGGGSADAAATLRILSRLWKLALGADDLARLGFKLGADIPACLYGRPSFIGGLGEAITAAPALPPVAMLLMNPGIPLNTAQVFQNYQEPFSTPARFTEAPISATALARLLHGRANDLTPSACRLVPAIQPALAMLASQPDCLLARMTGSGATIFGLFEDEAAASHARQTLYKATPSLWMTVTRLLGA